MATNSESLLTQAKEHEQQAAELRAQAADARRAELLATPITERLIYAAETRCDCGLGLAYDPAHPDGPRGAWRCSGVILHAAKLAPDGFKTEPIHMPPMPFMLYEIKSENQASARGLTTRPQG